MIGMRRIVPAIKLRIGACVEGIIILSEIGRHTLQRIRSSNR